MVFVDFSKAFDTVGRTGLWQLLRKYGCSEKFSAMIEALHKSRNRSVLQMGSNKVVYWPPALLHLPISNARLGFPRPGGWRLYTVQTER